MVQEMGGRGVNVHWDFGALCSQHRVNPNWTLPPSPPPSPRHGDTVSGAEQQLVPGKEEPGWAEQNWQCLGLFPISRTRTSHWFVASETAVFFLQAATQSGRETGWSAATNLKVRRRLGPC